MLRRLTAGERTRVRALRTPAAGDAVRRSSRRIADVATLRAQLLAELTRDFTELARGLLARMGDADDVALRAHPDDLARLADLDPRIARIADPALSRGGCLLQSASGELDATVETRVALLLAGAEVEP
jgi:hypothetical protein